jgi:hypothetical protein
MSDEFMKQVKGLIEQAEATTARPPIQRHEERRTEPKVGATLGEIDGTREMLLQALDDLKIVRAAILRRGRVDSAEQVNELGAAIERLHVNFAVAAQKSARWNEVFQIQLTEFLGRKQ